MVEGRRSAYALRVGERRFELSEGENVVGRSRDVDVQLEDDSVSRRHSVILCLQGRVSIRDLGSSNGTFVGETKVEEERELVDGDLLRLGKILLSVEIGDAPRCAVCGTVLPADALFCHRCGRRLSDRVEPPEPPSAPGGLPPDRPTIRFEPDEEESSGEEPPPAEASTRLAAGVVDLVVLGGIWLLVALPVPLILVVHGTLGESSLAESARRLFSVIVTVVVVAAAAATIGYFVGGWSRRGATIGERAFGLRLVAGGSSAVGRMRALVRFGAMVAAVVPLGAGLVPIFFGGRALHDRLSGTTLVRA